jgi:hypothetical protein
VFEFPCSVRCDEFTEFEECGIEIEGREGREVRRDRGRVEDGEEGSVDRETGVCEGVLVR